MIRSPILLTCLLTLSSCQQPTSQPQATEETPAVESRFLAPVIDSADARAAVDELEGWDAILEVMHDETASVQWTIGVKNDGSKRYGLAESVCMELDDRGLMHDRTWVRVVDRQAVMSNGGDFRAASLGGVRCATGDWIDP
jgi:hypothetical protein